TIATQVTAAFDIPQGLNLDAGKPILDLAALEAKENETEQHASTLPLTAELEEEGTETLNVSNPSFPDIPTNTFANPADVTPFPQPPSESPQQMKSEAVVQPA